MVESIVTNQSHFLIEVSWRDVWEINDNRIKK